MGLLCLVSEAFSILMDLFLLDDYVWRDLGLGITYLMSKYLAECSPFDLLYDQALTVVLFVSQVYIY